MSTQKIYHQQDVVAAMQHWENEHRKGGYTPGAGTPIPDECARLCELLATMQYHKEESVSISSTSPLIPLMEAAGNASANH